MTREEAVEVVAKGIWESARCTKWPPKSAATKKAYTDDGEAAIAALECSGTMPWQK